MVLNKAVCFLEFWDHLECEKAYDVLVEQIHLGGTEKKSKGVCSKVVKMLRYQWNRIYRGLFGEKEVLGKANQMSGELLFGDFSSKDDED